MNDQKLFIPQRIIISKNAANHNYTKEIIEKTKGFNPKVEVINIYTLTPSLPKNLSSIQRHEYIKNSLVLSEKPRSKPFLIYGEKPTHYGRNIEFNGSFVTNCSLNCQYCYLQNAPINKLWTNIYVDFAEHKEEIRKEIMVYKLSLILDNMIRFYRHDFNSNMPSRFSDVCNKSIRKSILNSKNKIDNYSEALSYFRQNFKNFLSELDLTYDEDAYRKAIDPWSIISDHHVQTTSLINISSQTEMLALEHLTGYINKLNELFNEFEYVGLSFQTKSGDVDQLLNMISRNRLHIIMNLNTDYVIDKYEHGTSSLTERIVAINKLLQTDRFNVNVKIDPIIMYDNYLKDYTALIDRLKTEIDFDKTTNFTLGSVKYNKSLIGKIKRNHPGTNLLEYSQLLFNENEQRPILKYSEQGLENIYKTLLKKLNTYTNLDKWIFDESDDLRNNVEKVLINPSPFTIKKG